MKTLQKSTAPIRHLLHPAMPSGMRHPAAALRPAATWARRMLHDQRGLNTVELVVIIAIVIGLALLFRSRITGFVTTLLDGLFSKETANELVQGVVRP